MQTDKEFEDFFREQLSGLEETPPAGAWEKISQEIKPRRNYYWQMAAAVLLCLVAISAFFGLRDQASSGKPAPVAITENAASPAQTSQNTPATASGKSTETTELAKTSNAAAASGIAASGVAELATGPASEIANTSAKARNTAPATSSSKTKVADLTGLVATSTINQNQPSKVASRETAKANTPTKTSPEITSRTASKTVAYNAQKPQNLAAKSAAELPAGQPENGMLSAAKTARTAKNTGLNLETESVSAAGKSGNVATASGQPEIGSKQIVSTGATSKTSGTAAIAETAESKPAGSETTNTLLAQNNSAKTDTITLNVIPALPDSVQNKTVALAKPEKKKDSRLAFTLKFTPGVIARRLIANPNDDKYLRFADGNGKRPADLGFDVSAILHHRISPKTTLDVSLAYTRLESKVNYSVSNGQVGVVSQAAFSNNSSAVKVGYAFAEEEARSEFTYGGFRAGLTQELVKSGHNTFFVSGGGGLNMLLSQNGTIHSDQAMQQEISSKAFHSVNSHVYLSAGLAKMVMPQVSVVLAPAFTYYLNSALREQQAFELKPYTFGLNFGLRYQL